MNADDRNLNDIFSAPRQFVVPLFQRPYVWNETENWEPLWQAVQEVADHRLYDKEDRTRPHFLGAVVLDQVPVPCGEVDARQVVDGQQRLTTLQVLLAAARDVAKECGCPDFFDAFAGLTQNRVPGSKLPNSRFKVWPTNRDRDPFRRVVEAGSPDAVKTAFGKQDSVKRTGHLLADAYLYFHESIGEWIAGEGEEKRSARLTALYFATTQQLVLVVIDLGENDDAQLIFETLNALGQPLLPADLVKNLLFHRAEQEGEAIETLYEEVWAPFDDDNDYWRHKIVQGRLKRPRVDVLLQHYLTLQRRQVIGATHLFAEFKDYLKSDKRSAAAHLESLRDAAAVFLAFDQQPLSTPEGRFRYRLEQLDTAMVYPLILEICAPAFPSEQRTAIMQDVESYLMRRAICCLTTKGYNRVFVDLLAKCAEGGFTSDLVRTFFMEREGESSRWPSDADVTAAMATLPLYTRMRRAVLRMLLEAVDEHMREAKSERMLLLDTLTIEHLMPQQWLEHWPLESMEEPTAAQERDQAVHRLGNLTLVTKKLNPSLSNAAWDTKKRALMEHAVLTMNRQLNRFDTWDESSIAERGQLLSASVLSLWPRPE